MMSNIHFVCSVSSHINIVGVCYLMTLFGRLIISMVIKLPFHRLIVQCSVIYDVMPSLSLFTLPPLRPSPTITTIKMITVYLYIRQQHSVVKRFYDSLLFGNVFRFALFMMSFFVVTPNYLCMMFILIV